MKQVKKTLSPPSLTPPPQPVRLGNWVLAILVHAGLIAALAWGTNWHSQSSRVVVSAELWSPPSSQALSPLASQATAAAKPIPISPSEAPTPKAPAETAPPPPKPSNQTKAPAIVTEKKTTKIKDTPPPAATNKPPATKAPSPSVTEQNRQAQLRRIEALAKLTGQPAATSDQKAGQGPASSGEYEALLRGLIQSNVSYQNAEFEKIPLTTSVEFDVALDGTVLRPRIKKSSGNAVWDNVALRAVEKTDTIPRDKNGFRPRTMIVDIKPRGQ